MPEPQGSAPTTAHFIPLCVPDIRGKEWEFIKECLDTNWVSSAGSFVDRFEHDVAKCLGRRYAVATTSGTAALHVALLLAGVEPDDEVLTSTLTFIAPANAVRYAGAWPVFMDAEPDFWQMDPEKLDSFLQRECLFQQGTLRNRTTGRRVKAILPVHILGHPVDIAPVLELARKYDLPVIEDACEGLGARYLRGTPAGNPVGSFGQMACLSFNGNKLITTGGGGMILTNDEACASRARYLTTQAKDDPVEYVHGTVGFNYRLTNIQAALGAAQLEDIESRIAAKRRIAEAYDRAFHAMEGIRIPREADWAFSTFWMYTMLIDPKAYGIDRKALHQHLRRNGVETRPLWQPLHLSPAHARAQSYHCDIAEHLYRQALSLPCSVGLPRADQERVIKLVQSPPREP